MVQMTRKIADYVRRVSLREPDVLARLRRATEAHPHAGWASDAAQAQLLALIAQMIGAKTVLEIGTFTGYTSLALAMALPKGGKVVTLDLAPEFPAVGRPFWLEAWMIDRIELKIGEAVASLDALIESPGPGSFDLAYIDCNKKDYDAYYERALTLVRPGGVIAIDNVLWGGSVADDTDRAKSTVALRALNQKLHGDNRVSIAILPMGDGLTLAWKRH